MPISPARDEYIIAGDLTFHCLQWGERGSPIICVHGLTANAFCFQALADELAPDHHVIAYDLRGRGDSDKPESGYSIPIHAADLAELIDALELDRPVVIGHSLGAMIALHFAAYYPDKLSKLVLIDAGGYLPWTTEEEQPAWLTGSIARLNWPPIASFEEYIQRLKLAPFLSPYWNEYLDIYFVHDVYQERDGSIIAKGYPAGVREDQLRIYEEFKPDRLWPSIQVPTLLLRAGQELLTPNDQLLPESTAEAIQQGIPHCRYINYPELNHYTIIFVMGDGVAQDIRNFVEAKEQ